MQLQVNPADLTDAQREAVAAFILTYPTVTAAPVGHTPPGLNKHFTAPKTAEIGGGEVEMTDDEAVALLTHDQESTLPETAFPIVDQEATAAFGDAPVVLPPGATVAPSTAVAGVSTTAPEVMTTFSQPSESLPVAQTPENAGAPAAPSTANPVEVDKTGIPWDGRIHSRTKSIKADGTWTAKRGVDPALVSRVEGELRQVMAAPAADPLARAAANNAQPAATATTSIVGAVPLGQSAPVTSIDTGDSRQQFIGLVGRTSAAINGQKITQGEVTEICAAVGLPSLPMLANRLDLVAQVAASIDALIASRT